MNPYFHNHIFTFDCTGAPILYVLADQDYQATVWQLAIDIRADSALEQKSAIDYMRLFDNQGGRFCVQTKISAEAKDAIYDNRRDAKIVVLKVKDYEGFKKLLIERLSLNVPVSIQREKELTRIPSLIGTISQHTSVVEKFVETNPDFVTDALRQHWVHMLTGLLMIEGEKLLMESGRIPFWARDFITENITREIDIRRSE